MFPKRPSIFGWTKSKNNLNLSAARPEYSALPVRGKFLQPSKRVIGASCLSFSH